jgi:hypothetical protein
MSTVYKEEHDLSERSLYDLAELVLNAANLPLNSDGTVKWSIDKRLKNVYTTAPLPENTCANCLQLIANAGCCSIYQDRNGVLRLSEFVNLAEPDTDYEISSFNSYSKPEMSLGKPVEQIKVKQYTYSIIDGELKSHSTEHIVRTGVSGYGETLILDNPLITDAVRAQVTASWVGQHLDSYRGKLDFSWRADVRLDALDSVLNQNRYDTRDVIMTDIEFKFNGAFRGKGEGRMFWR